jgi:hypothetical protein
LVPDHVFGGWHNKLLFGKRDKNRRRYLRKANFVPSIAIIVANEANNSREKKTNQLPHALNFGE